MTENYIEIPTTRRMCNSACIEFFSPSMCDRVRQFNGPDNEIVRERHDPLTGRVFLDRSYQEPDYMNLVDLAQILFGVDGVTHVSFRQYCVVVCSPMQFDKSVVMESCKQVIDAWIYTASLLAEKPRTWG